MLSPNCFAPPRANIGQTGSASSQEILIRGAIDSHAGYYPPNPIPRGHYSLSFPPSPRRIVKGGAALSRPAPKVPMSEQQTGSTTQAPAVSAAWMKVERARHPQRPYPMDFFERIFTDFSEIHGDRAFGDDEAVICGMARFPRPGATDPCQTPTRSSSSAFARAAPPASASAAISACPTPRAIARLSAA